MFSYCKHYLQILAFIIVHSDACLPVLLLYCLFYVKLHVQTGWVAFFSTKQLYESTRGISACVIN